MDDKKNFKNVKTIKEDRSANFYYGVDVHDKEAVKEKYKQLKRRHTFFTILSLVLIAVLSIFALDAYNVNVKDKNPKFYIKEKVENGTIYKGLGYKILKCDDNTVYKTYIEERRCLSSGFDNSFDTIFKKSINKYLEENKIVDKSNLAELNIEHYEFDEVNKEGGSDYSVDISYICLDGGNKCFKNLKETNTPGKAKIFVSLDKNNNTYDVKTFKTSGLYYEFLTSVYSEMLESYYVENRMADAENLRSFKVELLENHGIFTYKGVTYSDSYKVKIMYLCVDNTNECVEKELEDEFSNMSATISMFLDENGDVAGVGPSVIFDI